MAIQWKRYVLKAIFLGNIICLILLAGSNLAPYLSPANWWPVSLLGLIFPLLFALTVLFCIFWFIVQRRKAAYCLLLILSSIPNIISSFGFYPGKVFRATKPANTIRVITWNVGLMNYMASDSTTARSNNKKILDALQNFDADIVCLQEFFTAVKPGNYYNLTDSIARVSGFPYHYFSFDYPKFNGEFYSGSIIFSKHKIVDTAKAIYEKPFAGSIIRAGVQIGSDTVDIFTTRLQSVHFGKNEYRILNSLKKGGDGNLSGSKSLIRKLRFGYHERTGQVELVKAAYLSSHRPMILTGDLNDVPSSYTYRQIKGDMQDAWLNKNFGMGRTFRLIFPTLRIDYIFYNDFFTCSQTSRILSGGSDHHGLVTDIQLQRQP